MALALACASPRLDSDTALEPAADETPVPRPIGRASLPRAGHLTYQLHSVERVGDETQVDLLIPLIPPGSCGHSTPLRSVVWDTLDERALDR